MDYLQWLKDNPLTGLPWPGQLAGETHKPGSLLGLGPKAPELVDLIGQLVEGYRQIESSCRKLILASYLDPADREVSQSLKILSDHALVYLTEYAGYFSTLSDSSRGKRAAQALDPASLTVAKRLGDTYNKAWLPLLRQEKEAIEAYRKALDDLSLSQSRPATVKGEARRLLQSMSRDRRKRAYLSLEARMKGDKARLEEGFSQLHESRRSLGQEAGFPSFYDYLLVREGLTDKSRSKIRDFRLLTQKHLVPLVSPILAMQWDRLGIHDPRPWDLMYPANFGLPVLEAEAFPLDDSYIKAIRFLFPDKRPFFESMKKEGRLSLRVTGEPGLEHAYPGFCASDRMAGVMAAYFEEIDRSFLVLSQVSQENLARLLFSETGSLLYDQERARHPHFLFPEAEEEAVRQVIGQSTVFLSQRIWNLFYGKMTRYAREYDLTQLALDLPLYCALDEMEEFLCRARVTNLAVFRHAWNEIADRYGLAGTQAGYPGLVAVEDLWLYSPLLWARPLTGIFRSLAAVSVLGTFPLGRRHQQLEDHFSRLMEGEWTGQAFDRLAQAGYPSPFEEETLQKACFAIVDFLAL